MVRSCATTSPPGQKALIDEVLRQVESALGVNDTAQTLDRGQSLTFDEALGLASGHAESRPT
jgi:hypothetical protein